MSRYNSDTKSLGIGVFPMVGDLLHLGHAHALRVARKHCDKLVVLLNTDPTKDNPNKLPPVESVYERWVRLIQNRFVDHVIPYCGEEDLMRVLTTIDYDIRFVGEDHKDDWTGKEYEEMTGKSYYIIPREHGESSTDLKKRVVESMKNCSK